MGTITNGGPPGMGGWDFSLRYRLQRAGWMRKSWVVQSSRIPHDWTNVLPRSGKDTAIAKCVELQLQGHTVDMSVLDG